MFKVIGGAAAGALVGWLLLLLIANTGPALVVSFNLHVPRPEGGTMEITDKVDCSAVIGKIAVVLGVCFGALIGALAGHAADRLAAPGPPSGLPFGPGRGRT